MIVALNFIEIDSAGLAVVAGKGVPVGRLLMDKWAYEMDAEGLAKKWPHFTLAELQAALAYYYSHQEEVNRRSRRSIGSRRSPASGAHLPMRTPVA